MWTSTAAAANDIMGYYRYFQIRFSFARRQKGFVEAQAIQM